MVAPSGRRHSAVVGLEGGGADRLLDVRGVAGAVAVAGVAEHDLGGVNLGTVAALAVVALPAVLDEASGDVDAVALGDVLVDRLGGVAPADDVVPVGLALALLAVAVRRQPQLGDGRAAGGV